MADEEKVNLRLEMGHVLFIDLVGYSNIRVDSYGLPATRIEVEPFLDPLRAIRASKDRR